MISTVSAVITTFNRANIVSEAIASVLAQTIPVSELIVVDDGSIDATEAEVMRAFRNSTVTCRYFRKTNGGMASALNKGIQEAVGDWVAFLDDDDLWHKDHIERCLDLVGKLGDVGCICGLREENGALQTIPNGLLAAYHQSPVDNSVLIKSKSPLVSPFFTPVVGTSMVRKNLFEKIKFELDAGARLDIHFFWCLSQLTVIGLDLRSHGIGRQYRISLLSTDKEAPKAIKDSIALKRNADEIKMLRLLLSQLPSKQTEVFREMYQRALVGRSYLLRGMGRYVDGISWILSCWRDCQHGYALKELVFCVFRINSHGVENRN